MQMHNTAQIHQHEPKHMSNNQRPRVQLQEGELGWPVIHDVPVFDIQHMYLLSDLDYDDVDKHKPTSCWWSHDVIPFST